MIFYGFDKISNIFAIGAKTASCHFPLRRESGSLQYVTYEALFAFANLIFSAICAGVSVITLVMAIASMNNSCSKHKKHNKKRNK